MKSKALALCLFFILGVVAVSCNKDDYQLSLSIDHYDASADVEKVVFTVTSNLNWAVGPKDKWITADKTSGYGVQDVTLTIGANPWEEERTAIVIVSAGDELIKEITITQAAFIFGVNTQEIKFDVHGTPQTITVTSKHSWTLDIPAELDWLKADVLSGDGDAVVTLSPTPYTERVIRNGSIVFTCLKRPSIVSVSQEAVNEAPTSPALIVPGNGIGDVKYPVAFSWSPSADANGDVVSYDLYVSEDGQNWGQSISRTTETSTSISSELLKELTTYHWKIVASDIFGGKSESGVNHFITANYGFYPDGHWELYQKATSGASPVNLVVVGDGFINHDYLPGGTFDAVAARAIEAFFSVEPYPTYRNHFDVYKVVAHSSDRGATVKADFSDGSANRQIKNTVFNSIFEGGVSTAIACTDKTVFEYVQKIPAITEQDLPNTTVLVLINLDVYAGTASMYKTGAGIAMCPTGNESNLIVIHEGGGHAFGRLLDEYIYHDLDYPQSRSKVLTEFRQDNVWSYGANVSLTDDLSKVHWNHYFTKVGYERVNLWEGADLYAKKVWRAEEQSCMDDKMPLYFNAPSREAIVRRIMSISGKEFNRDEFYNKDKTQFPTSVTRSSTRRQPLGRPVLIWE